MRSWPDDAGLTRFMVIREPTRVVADSHDPSRQPAVVRAVAMYSHADEVIRKPEHAPHSQHLIHDGDAVAGRRIATLVFHEVTGERRCHRSPTMRWWRRYRRFLP